MAHLYRDFRVVGCAAEHMDGELGLCERIHDRRTSNRYPKGCVCALSQLKWYHTHCKDWRSHSCTHLLFSRRCNKGAALEKIQQLGEYPVGSMAMTSSTANDVEG